MTAITPAQAEAVLAEADLIYNQEQINAALDRMAAEISAKLRDANPLVLCVMVGGMIPAGQLVTRLHFPLQLDYIHATRYRGKTYGGELQWLVRPTFSLQDRVVLLVDDILDEGVTLKAIVASCRDAGAREVYTAALINKLHDRKQGMTADFAGLDVEDRYVFGYGMDYKDYLRNVAGIYAAKE